MVWSKEICEYKVFFLKKSFVLLFTMKAFVLTVLGILCMGKRMVVLMESFFVLED